MKVSHGLEMSNDISGSFGKKESLIIKREGKNLV